MVKKLIHFLYEKYSGLAETGIVAYMLCSFMTVTVLDSIGPLSLMVKLIRYGLYAFLSLMCLAYYFGSHPVDSLKEALFSLFAWLKDHLLLCTALITSILNFVLSGSLIPFAIVLLLIAARPLNLQHLLKMIFITQLAAAVLVVALSQTGLLTDLIYSSTRGRYRHSLGYIYPLEMHSHFFFLFLLGAYLFQKKYGFIAFAVISAVNYGVFYMTLARTNFVLIEACALLLLIAVKVPREVWEKVFGWKYWKPLLFAGTILMFTAPIAACLMYTPNSRFWDFADDLMTGRLSLCREALETYPLTLFGQSIEWLGSGGPNPTYIWQDEYNFADISYVKDLLDYGVILYGLVAAGYYWMMQNFSKKANAAGIVCCISVLLCSIMEPRLLSISLNSFLLFLCIPLLYTNRRLIQWMKEDVPVYGPWSRLPKAGRIAAVGAVLALCAGFVLYMNSLHGFGERRQAIRALENERKDWQAEIMSFEKPEDMDPYLYSRYMAHALKDSSAAYEEMVKKVPIGRLRSYYINKEDFNSIQAKDAKEEEYKQKFEEIGSLTSQEIQKQLSPAQN